MRYLLSFLFLLLPIAAHASPEVGQRAPDFTAKAADGATVKLSDYKGKIVVLEWTNPLCPFVHKHYDSGNMQSLQRYAAGKGVIWLTVNSSAPDKEGHVDAQVAKDYIRDNKTASTHYLLDDSDTIAHLYEAKTTPHMFVIDAKGNIAYMGAIDSKATPDPKDIASSDNYVKDAIDDLLTGKPIAVASTQSYGCFVKYGDN